MQLFEKWKSATEAYNSFYEEVKCLGVEVSMFLKSFNDIDNSLTKAILKMLNDACDRFSILVKTAESVEDYPLVFSFKNDSNGEIWNLLLETSKTKTKPCENL
ncbi:hypothetical protein [Helicobacter pylori]|uniref:hypothetical protein n=1 Tax=Helicobacter pylori TaxID=210 RepID=UPI001E5DC19E|nr:hypothetical protein [Helicobacter pylori]